jgi:hypothetical protein
LSAVALNLTEKGQDLDKLIAVNRKTSNWLDLIYCLPGPGFIHQLDEVSRSWRFGQKQTPQKKAEE